MGENTPQDTTGMGHSDPSKSIPNEGHPDDWVKNRLGEMGLTEDDIGNVVEAGGGLNAEGGRWKICPRCKSNLDLLSWATTQDGEKWPKLLGRAEVECPNCGTFGELCGDNPMNEPHEKLKTFKAKAIHNPFPWANHYLRIGKSLIESNALFPSDRRFDPDEPHWPRDMGACVIAAALMVCSSIKKKGEHNTRGEDKKRKWTNKSGKDKDKRGRGPSSQGNDKRRPVDVPRQEGGGGFNF